MSASLPFSMVQNGSGTAISREIMKVESRSNSKMPNILFKVEVFVSKHISCRGEKGEGILFRQASFKVGQRFGTNHSQKIEFGKL